MRHFRILMAAVFILAVGVPLNNALAKEAAGTPEDPVIDSRMTLEEAVKGACPPEIKEKQALVDVLYYSFDARVHKGQVVIDKRLAGDIQSFFADALKEKFPILSVIPVSDARFSNDDGRSMLADNTSAFNYRPVTGAKTLSNHAYGFAIDINPMQNPYIKKGLSLPPGAVYDKHKPGTLDPEGSIVKAFLNLGWTWGGSWKSLKDYQHFEKVPQGTYRNQ